MTHRRGMIVGSAVAIAALTLSTLPAAAQSAAAADPAAPVPDALRSALAAAAADPAPPAPTGMLKAMQRDLGITADEARTRVVNEHRAARTEPVLRAGLGKTYGGAWTTGDTAELVVATTDRDDARAIRAAGAEPEVVQHGLSELEAAKDALDRAAKRTSPTSATPVWYVDIPTNSVIIGATRADAAKSLIAAAGLDRDLVRVVTTDEQPRPYYDLRGGDAYYKSPRRCSIGFPVTKGSQQGFVTAGHCGTKGETTAGYNRASQGTFQGSSFPGNDYAWVSTNGNWAATARVKGASGADVLVTGSTQAPVGSSVCRSGSTTGWRCGTIQQHNTTVTYLDHGVVSGVTRTDVCAENGDSGGPFVSGTEAQGITSGGSGDCASGGRTYYQPVNEVLTAYGLTLAVDGPVDGEDPADCRKPDETYTGSLSSGKQAVHPDGSYYYAAGAGTHLGCLDGPSGADFDLYLQWWTGETWTIVAQSITPGAEERVEYRGGAGYYRWGLDAYSGSGDYTLSTVRP